MLKLTHAQMRLQTGVVVEGSFRADLQDRLQHDFAAPPHALTSPQITERAVALWHQAPKHGMRSHSDVTRYHYLLMGLWEGWAESPDRPWITGILQRDDLTGTAKLDFIYDTLGAV